jgi:hypothetical protein
MTNKLFSQGIKEARRIALTPGEKHSMLFNLNTYIKEHPAEFKKEFFGLRFLKYLISLV